MNENVLTPYELILSDGTKLVNLYENGSYLVSAMELDEDIFRGNLSPVTIVHNGNEEVHEHMILEQLTTFPDYPGQYFIFLKDADPGQDKYEKLRADVDYLYMMTGLEEGGASE